MGGPQVEGLAAWVAVALGNGPQGDRARLRLSEWVLAAAC